ncbi:MAG: DEAD/DEAH box helicase [Lactobacillaceae bacterium]|jgi:competence protein ComFA|nr:DEAD/DEAH box helicase [Lactobacillaceae bacterium]
MNLPEVLLCQSWWQLLLGRQLLFQELPNELQVFLQKTDYQSWWPELVVVKGIEQVATGQWFCQRCFTEVPATQKLATGALYCTACLGLGRISQRDQLVSLPIDQAFAKNNPLTWSGQLTQQQAQVAKAILAQFQNDSVSDQLLWAVTGAGKTEMIFPIIAAALQRGQRVAVVAPRLDVCNELYPRLQQAFAKTSLILLHGQQHQTYYLAQLVVATTHQLLRFKQAFDLLIIDEVDSFPFAGNQMLANAVRQALKPNGQRLFLSATPPSDLQRLSQRGQLPLHYLPQRFHGRNLPVPEILITTIFKKTIFAPKVQRLFRYLFDQQRRWLVFVPQAAQLPRYQDAWQAAFPRVPVATVHANDPQRLAKVAAFRAGQGKVLFTTTILERGVTFNHIDVVILAADHRQFSTSNLVQIAGRADRAFSGSRGHVYFCCQYYTWAIQQACRQINHLNQVPTTKS